MAHGVWGGAEGGRVRGDKEQRPDGTWVNRCTEHAPPNTCAWRAPSPHPCSSKRPEHSACGEGSEVPKTRLAGQVSSVTIKGRVPKRQRLLLSDQGEGWGESLRRDTELVHFIPAVPEQQ